MSDPGSVRGGSATYDRDSIAFRTAGRLPGRLRGRAYLLHHYAEAVAPKIPTQAGED